MVDGLNSFSEKLWADWLAGSLDVPPPMTSVFDLDAAPEPYVAYDAGSRPLVALLTNPGRPMKHQLRTTIEADRSLIRREDNYATTARKLGDFYGSELGGAAGRRIAALKELSSMLGYEGVLQVDACPFHSAYLPKKSAVLEAIREGGLLGRHAGHVQAFLEVRPVVIVAAVSTRVALEPGMALSPWLTWQAKLAGIDPHRAEFVPLVEKGNKTTAAALIDRVGGAPKVLVRMMGGNHLPGAEGLRVLGHAMKGKC